MQLQLEIHGKQRRFFAGFCTAAAMYFCLFAAKPLLGQESLPDIMVDLKAQESSIYGILDQVSRDTGFFFVYDNQVVDNSRMVSIGNTRSSLFDLVRSLIPAKRIEFKLIGYHVLIFEKELAVVQVDEIEKDEEPLELPWFSVSGRVLDKENSQPLPYASVGIPHEGIGVSTNLEGVFRFRVPNEMSEEFLLVSYLGYKATSLPLQLLTENHVDIFLETEVISLQEVVIRDYDPVAVIGEMLKRRESNYIGQPVYHYNFYREGVKRNQKLINYSEGIFQVFKEPLFSRTSDQVKVLRGRNVENANNTDTLVLKLKAGVQSTLELDIMNKLPDFLDEDFMQDYEFSNAGFSTKNGRSAHAIDFKQKKSMKKPLYKGLLFVDTEDFALIEAEFEINPEYIKDAGRMFFIGWKREYIPTMEKARYSIMYQKIEGTYHIQHIRGDLDISVTTRRGKSTNRYSAFFETVVVKVETNEVKRFRRREVIKPNTIFLDLGYSFDYGFWGKYNIISPETSIIEAFSDVSSKIESLLPE